MTTDYKAAAAIAAERFAEEADLFKILTDEDSAYFANQILDDALAQAEKKKKRVKSKT